MARKIGRQTPTYSVVQEYNRTLGPKAIKLYNISKATAMEWQELLIYDIMAVNEEGLWTHSKYGWAIARRNGKSEVIEIREIYGLLRGEKILHTAHRTTTSHSSWERLVARLTEIGLVEDIDFKTTKQMGLETIRMTETGGRISFRTRSSKGGLGEGYDLLVIDEAQEYTDDQSTALKYVVSDSKNPQTLYCGTPPTVTSSGTVFANMRNNAMKGVLEATGWAEWSIPHITKNVRDRALWYETNPSLGIILTERAIEAELEESDDVVDFCIQRLGVWLRYNQKSAITTEDWNKLKVEGEITISGKIYAGVKFGKDGENACLSVAIKTTDGRVFVECLDCQPIRNGNGWIVEYLKALKPNGIWIDGANGQQLLADDLKEAKVRHVTLPSVNQIVAAAAAFEQGIFDEQICHAGQPSMVQAATNCEKRAIGSKGGFGYRSIKEGVEIGILESAMTAFYQCSQSKERNAQRIKA